MGLMGYMEGDLIVGMGQIEMTQSGMAGSSIHRKGEVMDTGSILVLVLTGMMMISLSSI